MLLAGTFIAGALVGIAVAVALSGPPTGANAVPPASLDVLLRRGLPAMCASRPVQAEQAAQGDSLLDEARAADRDKSETKSKILALLREGIKKNPSNYQLFYEFGRQAPGGSEQDDADECVCQLAPDSKECRNVEKVRAR